MNAFLVILFILLIFSVRFFTVLFHELGHAFFGLLFLKGDFRVYVGSHGEGKRTLNFKIGRLTFFLKFNPFEWRGGLCRGTNSISSWKRNFLYTAGGPFASFFSASLFLSILIFVEKNDNLKFVACFYFLSSMGDFLRSIIPNSEPIEIGDGATTYNDAFQMAQLFKQRKVYRELMILNKYISDKQYSAGGKEFLGFPKEKKDAVLYRQGIYLLLKAEDFKSAKIYIEELAKITKLTPEDNCNYGFALDAGFNDHENALFFYDKALNKDPKLSIAYNNRGYVWFNKENYEKAIWDFNKAIELEPNLALSFCNRGLTELRMGNHEAAFKDLSKSIELDNCSAIAYKNLGLYYVEKEDFLNAKINFEKAKGIKNNFAEIDQLILSAKMKIEEVTNN